ncbi:MAG TPA: Uma2 family endonuclease [Pyrinomonadaceae bacterium]|jgi:Uma2 family endonuclease
MSLPQALPVFTSEEYLSLERMSEIRHEYLDGFVYAMAGESPEHSTICFNLAGILHAQLRDKPCRGFSPNMKVRTDESGLYAYPDLAVVCGEPLFHDERRDVLVNPTVIFEVLSPSTEAYDRGEKFLRYRTHLATLKDYVLVTQSKAFIEHFSRQPDGAWLYTVTNGLSESLALASIDCRLPLEEVYRLVTV